MSPASFIVIVEGICYLFADFCDRCIILIWLVITVARVHQEVLSIRNSSTLMLVLSDMKRATKIIIFVVHEPESIYAT